MLDPDPLLPFTPGDLSEPTTTDESYLDGALLIERQDGEIVGVDLNVSPVFDPLDALVLDWLQARGLPEDVARHVFTTMYRREDD